MIYLQNSAQIRECINNLFSEDGEKWAIVGFVGYGALDQLPTPINQLSVVCWPKPGATHPDGVRRLIGAGVKVYFCEHLHSKLFWKSKRGLIVGSANLSRNALGTSNQHEFGVYVPDDTFDIRTVLAPLNYVEVTSLSMRKLDTAHVAARARDPDCDEPLDKPLTFLQSRQLAFPRRWKLVTWTEPWYDTTPIKEAVMACSGKDSWVTVNGVGPGKFEVGDFVLQVHVDTKGYIQRANCAWLRVELIANIAKRPAIVQLKPLSDGALPPFQIDSMFKRIFKDAFNAATWEELIDDTYTVREKFVQRLQALYKEDG